MDSRSRTQVESRTQKNGQEPGQPAAAGKGPLPLAAAVGGRTSWREPRWSGERLLWLEQRPAERGRTTLMIRERPGQAPRELTPGAWNLRSRVHEYGGGAWCVAGDTVVFSHDGDRGLWRLDLPPADGAAAGPPPEPRPLTPPPPRGEERAFADGRIDQRRHRWIGVLERQGRDQLVAVPLAGGEPRTLWQPADFCGYAVLSPSGSHLAWVEWQQPHMPWERSQLWLARLRADGTLAGARPVAGSGPGEGLGESVFQPLWAGSDLVVANDRSGWWNLERLVGAEALPPDGHLAWEPLLPMEAEFGQPQWVYGLATIAWDGERLLACACREGRWQLGLVHPGAAEPWQPFALPFDDLETPVAAPGRLAAIAAGPGHGSGLLELEIGSGRWQHTPAAPPGALATVALSAPEALWFAGHGGRPTHAWFYPPPAGAGARTPLLLRAHSGPTGMARTGLNPAIQFWTSRGWAVLDVNYGGSSGFGRAYRERLDGQWGVVDVADCAAAARTVVAAGRADGERVAMEGGSAAGFTVLALLCGDDVLRAGACRYPVTDLTPLAGEGHRFEAHYFETLIGPWPEASATYRQRSPLHHAERIQAPVILFHGLDDPVVPAAQSQRLALALRERGLPVELHLFPGEGHGFRDGAVQRRVLEATELFFRRGFGL
jgi:dipeptidyl aminopeptidase/acylaminoacyl peptidase